MGRPWGNTSLITGYSARDLLFRPTVEEYFNTSSYVGLQHKFGKRLTAAVICRLPALVARAEHAVRDRPGAAARRPL